MPYQLFLSVHQFGTFYPDIFDPPYISCTSFAVKNGGISWKNTENPGKRKKP